MIRYIRITALAGLLCLACTTKVSEWVLLNAAANQYTLVYLHKSANTEAVQSENSRVEKNISGANIRFRDVVKPDASQPYYALYYENRLFARYDNPSGLKNLVSSPVREKIATEIMAGRLCVMLHLKTGDRAKDEKSSAVIRRALDASPFGGIITFIELDRNDGAEGHFVNMLLNVESDLKGIKDPMLFGIFGKFKALEPLVAGGITEENIGYMIDFLTADCSCLIKDDLPGTDILFPQKWDSPATALVNAIIDANPILEHR